MEADTRKVCKFWKKNCKFSKIHNFSQPTPERWALQF